MNYGYSYSNDMQSVDLPRSFFLKGKSNLPETASQRGRTEEYETVSCLCCWQSSHRLMLHKLHWVKKHIPPTPLPNKRGINFHNSFDLRNSLTYWETGLLTFFAKERLEDQYPLQTGPGALTIAFIALTLYRVVWGPKCRWVWPTGALNGRIGGVRDRVAGERLHSNRHLATMKLTY